MAPVACAVEGPTDEPVARRLLAEAGLQAGPFKLAGGKSGIDKDLRRWNVSAARRPWLVIRDLDHDDLEHCIPALRSLLLGNTPARDGMCFRLAVRSVEAWLIADHEGFRSYFRLRRSRMPDDIDAIEDPKSELIDRCRRSMSRDIREGIPPVRGSGRSIGPEYVAIVGEYCQDHWNPQQARTRSPSLDRALKDLDRLRVWLGHRSPESTA